MSQRAKADRTGRPAQASWVSRLIAGRVWRPLMGVLLGLYISRLAAECSGQAWRLWELGALIAVSLVLGVLLVWGLGRTWRRLDPLLLCLLYVAWPRVNLSLAIAMGALAAVLLLALNHPPIRWPGWAETLTLLMGLALYVSTLAPTILPADAGEFQLVAATLGIAHPPGYPLYTLLGKLFSLMPLGELAYRVNLFGAVCAALTLAVLARMVRRATGSSAAALVSAAALGCSATFWAQGTTANIRSLAALLTVLTLERLARWDESHSARDLTLVALWFGLGVGHHASLIFVAPAMLAFILLSDRRILREPRRWISPLIAATLSLLVILYLPLRSRMNPAFDPTPIRSWAGLMSHVLATGFRGDMLHYRTWDALRGRLGVWAQIMRLQFGMAIPWALAASLIPLARRGRLLVLLVGAWALNTLAALTYRAPQTVEYLMPSYVALAALLGCGLGLAPRVWRLTQAAYAGLVALALLGVSLYALPNQASYVALSQDRSTREYAEAILKDAPQSAVILSSWHRATPFWYLQLVEGARPDVDIVYVHPEGATPNDQVWLRRIGESIGERPVIVTNRYQSYAQSDYRWVPLHGAWWVRTEPLIALPHEIEPVGQVFGQEIELLGYRLDRNEVEASESLDLRVYWRPLTQLGRDYYTFAQLVGPQGVIGQGDLAHNSLALEPGEIRVDAYRIATLPHAAPGEYALITGFYYAEGDGWARLTDGQMDHASLARVSIRPQSAPLPTRQAMQVGYGAGWRLTGLDVDRSLPGQTRLYLHWERRGLSLPLGGRGVLDGAPIRLRAQRDDSILAETLIPLVPVGRGATVALDLPSQSESGAISLHLLGQDGREIAPLGPWHRPRAQAARLALPEEGGRYVPLGGQMVYLGLSDEPTRALRGEETVFRPSLLATRPIVDDYSVSLGLLNSGAGWERKSDGTPALGAIPTFKWVTDWRVEDPRGIFVEASAPLGEARVTLTVYDAFTLEPLAVLDERLARLGQGVTLDAGAVEIVAP